MPIFSQIPIRCRLSIVSNPPAYPIDDNTGEAPAFWRAQDIAIQVGIFDADNDAVDLSNIDTIQLTFRPSQSSPYYYVSTVITASSIIPSITYSGWSSGNQQQATFYLTPAETDFPTDGGDSAQVWMEIRAYTATGTSVVYGAGYVTVKNSGVAVPPLTSIQVVSYHATTNTTGDSTITPTKQIHTEKLTIAGTARTSKIIVANYNSMAGARVNVSASVPATPGITLEFYSVDDTGSPIATFNSDVVAYALSLGMFFDGAAWNVETAIAPSV